MQTKKLGRHTVAFSAPPAILGHANVGGKKESQGPLAKEFDLLSDDDSFGEQTWEKAESAMQKQAITAALNKAGQTMGQMDFLLSGDLLNQCIGSSFAARGQDVPFLGLYGACSTMAESMAIGAMLLDGGFGNLVVCATSSHFCTAERQYRNPLEYGSQRTPTAQWTATAAGAVVLTKDGTTGPFVTHATVGKIVDKGITNPSNMGAAMAPAAYDTLSAHFRETGRTPEDYDLIATGDLGKLGRDIVVDFFSKDGVNLAGRYVDCGVLLYDIEQQDAHCGASGCGCAASVLTGYLLNGMKTGRWQRILFCPTGALMSPTSTLQGESIPGIAHAIAIDMKKE